MSEIVIEWTEELRKRVAPRSAADLPEEKERKPETSWTAARKRFGDHAKKSFLEGLEHATPEVRAFTERAIELASSKDMPPTDTPVGVLALFWRMLNPWGSPVLTRFLVQRFGLEMAVRSWIDAAYVTVLARNHQNQSLKGSHYIVNATPALVSETHLREAILRASPAEYAAARELVAPLYAVADPRGRLEVVRRFPNERAWVEDLVEIYLADTSGRLWGIEEVLHDAVEDLELVKKVLAKSGPDNGNFESLLHRFGTDIVPAFLESAARTQHPAGYERLARIFSIVSAPEVATYYAKNLGKKAVRKYAVEYFPARPALRGALAPYTKGKSRVAKMAQDLIEQCERAERAESLELDEVPESELPEILRRPPWAGGDRPKRKSIVIKDAPELDGPIAIHAAFPLPTVGTQGELDAAGVEAWLEKLRAVDEKKKWPRKVQLFTDRDMGDAQVPREVRLRVWNDGSWPYEESAHTVGLLLGESGLDALPGLYLWADKQLPRANSAWTIKPLVSLEAPALAPAFAYGLRKKGIRDLTRSWMRRYTEAAIAGLLPAAVGPKGKRRTVAEQALRWLATEGHEARIRERASELGKKGPTAVDEILTWDPLYDCPAKPPKMSARYKPALYTRPKLLDGRVLTLSAIERLGEMLAFTPADETYVGIQMVKDLCDERSMAEHCWDLASSWENGGSDKRDIWMLFSLVHLADDEVVRRTTPALKAGAIVDVLSYVGTEAAAMELATISARGAKSDSAYNAARRNAEAALDRIAEAQGIERDDLDDQLTPTCGLDERGAMVLDFGSRTFTVGFDEHLDPEIIDDSGTRRKVLARGAKADDPEKVENAKLLWNELKEDVGAIAMMRIEAIERAMLGDRRWSAEAFETHWAKHPLMMHLARRIVWSAHGPEDRVVPFRVTEDGTYADANEEPITLEGVTDVRVPHPLRWPDDTLPTWRTMFQDYELIQPYPQLGRPTPVVLDSDLASDAIKRRKTAQDVWEERRKLEAHGYQPESTMRSQWLEKRFSPEWRAHVQIRAVWDKGKHQGVDVDMVLLREDGTHAQWREAPNVLLTVLDELGLFEATLG